MTLDNRRFSLLHTRRHIPQIRLSLALGLLFFGLYTVFDYHIFPESYETLVWIRFATLPIAASIMLPLTYHRRFPRWSPALLGGGVIVGGISLTLLQVFTEPPHNSLYFTGMLVLLLFCYGVLMIPAREALLAGFAATVLHSLIMLFLDTRPAIVLVAETYILVSVNIAGAVMVRFRDKVERKAMEARHRISLQNGELHRNAQYLEERVLERTRELQNANHQLHRALEERTQLIQEVYHRVGNNLQMIGSLFQLEGADDSIDPHEKLYRMESRVRSMALVHSVLYNAEDYSRVSFREVVGSLPGLREHRGLDSLPSVTIGVDSGEVCLGLDQAVPAALLVNELLTIACRETENRQVTISLSTVFGKALISVAGPRWDREAADLACRDTLSGHLISALATQIGGAVGSDEKDGSVTVVFPVSRVLPSKIGRPTS